MKRSEVSEFNGKDGRPAYIIFKGKVYDVTKSRFWKNGTHMNRHKAGEDMTDFITMAPHGEDLLKRDNIKFICDIEKEEEIVDNKQKYRELYSKYHPHPIFIHYPMGILYFGAFMLLLYLTFNVKSFEQASFYALVCGTLSVFPAALSGILSWWLNYEMTMTKIFKNKLYFSFILGIITALLTIYRAVNPQIEQMGLPFYVYALLYFLCVPVVTFIAYNGGKITWPN